ncbi:MAG: SDR family oxidoreductase [Betaproteobacteria bacterium]|nr:SDR family oxidoreductase [Betaproteobacteria bacterium]
MKISGKVCVVTGAASGIGKALVERFAAEGALGVVCADLNESNARAVAASVKGIAVRCDVSSEAELKALVDAAKAKYGRVDVFCSNAGIIERAGLEATAEQWRRTLEVNLMAHVYAARAVVPLMLAQGGGYIVATASAAGLLMQPDSATYTVSKHGAVAFAEWLSVNYHDKGIRVSCLCPQGVRTPMLLGPKGDRKSFLFEGSVSAEDAAARVVEAMDAERFLVLPHPEVGEYERRKANDRERWLTGMRRMRAKIASDPALRGDD